MSRERTTLFEARGAYPKQATALYFGIGCADWAFSLARQARLLVLADEA